MAEEGGEERDGQRLQWLKLGLFPPVTIVRRKHLVPGVARDYTNAVSRSFLELQHAGVAWCQKQRGVPLGGPQLPQSHDRIYRESLTKLRGLWQSTDKIE